MCVRSAVCFVCVICLCVWFTGMCMRYAVCYVCVICHTGTEVLYLNKPIGTEYIVHV